MKPRKFIESLNGKFFTIDFIKKDGSIRSLVARGGVTKHLKGSGNPTPPHLVTVFDIKDNQYKSIIEKNIVEIKSGNKNWRIE